MINISPTKMGSDPRYIFAVGKIRVLETYLLNNQQVVRLLETKDAKALWEELANVPDYEEHLGQLKDPHEFEVLLDLELKRVYDLIFSLDPDRQVLNLLALRHDFHNCKALSKGQFLGEEADLALSELGLYPIKEWEQILAGEGAGQSELIPADLLQVIRGVQAKLEGEEDLRLRDLFWDQALYRYLHRQLQATKNVFAQAWLRMRIDCLNLAALMRCKQQKAHKRTLDRALLDHGFVPREQLLSAYDGALEELPSRFAASPYAELLQDGVQAYQKEGSFSSWEKLVDDFEIEFLKQSRLVALGVEPLFAYLLAKENEVKVLRILLVGKLNHLAKPEISKRIRRLYA